MTTRFTVLTAAGPIAVTGAEANMFLVAPVAAAAAGDNAASWLYDSARRAGNGAAASLVFVKAVLRGGAERVIDVR